MGPHPDDLNRFSGIKNVINLANLEYRLLVLPAASRLGKIPMRPWIVNGYLQAVSLIDK
jgi:hypothetical protein